MSENFYTILTNAGLAAIANAVINQTQVNFAKLGVGDGNGAYYTPTQEATALRNQVWIGNISSVTADTTNPNWVNVETVIPGNVGGFEIRELGIFDDNNVLLAIGKLPLTYKPNFAEGSSKDLYIKAIFEVTNASAVTLKVDPSVIYASKKYVDDKVAAVVSGLENAQQQLKNHEVDYVKHPGSGVTTRSANTYSVTLDPAPDAYVDLMGVVFKADADVSNSVVSINVNGLGPRIIYKTNKSHPTLKKDAVYSIRYSASVSAFILQGEGGSGNAQPNDVRKDKTFTNDNGEQTGTLVAYGTSEEIPLDTLSSGITSNFFGDLPLVLNYGSILNNTAVAPTLVRFNHVDKVLHLAAGMAYKAYDGQSLKWQTLTTNTTGYTHSLDAENRILYISVLDGKIAKRSSNNVAAQYWETTDTGMDGANRVTHIPGDQGFVGFQNGNIGLRFATNGNKVWTLAMGYIKGTITAICATQDNEIFVVAYEYTGSYVSTLYKINGATGAVTTTTLEGFQSVELVNCIRVDEDNQRLVLLGAYGTMQTRAISNPSTVLSAMSGIYTNETKGMEIDNQGRIYVVHNSGKNGVGLTKFTPQLGALWQCKFNPTSSFTIFMLGLDIDRTPNTPYPELYIALVQGSGGNGEIRRNKQTYTIMT